MHTPTKLISTLMLAMAALGNVSAQTKEEDHKAHHPQAAAMHEMHDKHQKEMKQIHGTKDPAKRQKLMDKHMKEMHEHMDKSGGMGMGSKMGAKPMQDAASK